jgi:hypothetical protein
MEFRLLRGEQDLALGRVIEEIDGYIHEFNELSKTHKFVFRLIAGRQVFKEPE